MADRTGSDSASATVSPTRLQRQFSVLLSFAAFSAGYVISAGPAALMARKFDFPMMTGVIEWLYAPLILIVRLKIPFASDLIRLWVGLFT